MTRKRSARIDLSAMRKSGLTGNLGLAAVVTGSLSAIGCGQSTVPAQAYQTLSECRLYKTHCESACESGLNRAEWEGTHHGPRYQQEIECEYDFGRDQCVRVDYDMFGPRLAGFLLNSAESCPQTSSVDSQFARALYSPAKTTARGHGRWVTGGGCDLAPLYQRNLQVPRSLFGSTLATGHTLRRGGFGQLVRTQCRQNEHYGTSTFRLGG